MEVKKIIKTDTGTYSFQGTLTEEEHEYILTIGLLTLFENGAIDEDDFDIPEGSNIQ